MRHENTTSIIHLLGETFVTERCMFLLLMDIIFKEKYADFLRRIKKNFFLLYFIFPLCSAHLPVREWRRNRVVFELRDGGSDRCGSAAGLSDKVHRTSAGLSGLLVQLCDKRLQNNIHMHFCLCNPVGHDDYLSFKYFIIYFLHLIIEHKTF